MNRTPGPWTVINHSWSETSILAANRRVCGLSIESDCTEETQELWEAQMAADAALLAASPDLLELLGVMFDAYEEGAPCHEYTDGEPGAFLGRAIHLSNAQFERIADLLNRLDPRDVTPKRTEP